MSDTPAAVAHDAALTPAASPAGWGGALTRVVAVAASLVALGQSASTWIDGHFHSEMEREKTSRELQLADLKERSALAESYLKLILAKDTPEDGRAILYSALGQLKGHPLQQWAQDRYLAYQRSRSSLKEAFDSQAAAAARVKDAGSKVAVLEADIETVGIKIAEAMDNPSVRDPLQLQRIELSKSLAFARAELTLARAPAVGTRLELVTERVDAALLGPLFPAASAENIKTSAPYLRAALREFSIADPKQIAAIIATVAAETPDFATSAESSVAAGERYQGKLGNTQPGDGAKYRGRGWILLTGRDNYAAMSQRLGLGTRLVDSPDDAKSPEVASRVLVAWFAGRMPVFTQALEEGNLEKVRALVSGQPSQMPRFRKTYEQALEALTRSAGTTAQPAVAPGAAASRS